MNAAFSFRRLTALACMAAVVPLAVRAEAPMVSDDASTLPAGGAKVEAEWGRDGRTRGLGLALGYAPLAGLETELSFGRARDHSATPATTLRATGLAVKWVPWQLGEQTALGVKLDYGVERASHGGGTVRGHQLLGLYTHEFRGGMKLHLNAGRAWARATGGVRAAVQVWALGLDLPLGSEAYSLVADLYGESGGAPTGRQLGLRWRAAEGLALSAGVGRRGGDTQVLAVGAYEF